MMQTLVDCDRTGNHELITCFLSEELTLEIHNKRFHYSVSRMSFLKPDIKVLGAIPDVVVIDRRELVNEPLWQKSSVIQNGKTVPLVIEVVSTNWRDDYAVKLAEYEAMGIAEYWIVDYRALGAVRHIGKPKQPTVTVCKLIDREYQLFLFKSGDRIVSDVFPSISLSMSQVMEGIGN